jgi:hypothetical protein
MEITKQDKINMFCNICCTESIYKILKSKQDIDLKCQLICELFDYVEQKTITKTKIKVLKWIRKINYQKG